jgi:hypothetical protein
MVITLGGMFFMHNSISCLHNVLGYRKRPFFVRVLKINGTDLMKRCIEYNPVIDKENH